jgi:hypothetical protein
MAAKKRMQNPDFEALLRSPKKIFFEGGYI